MLDPSKVLGGRQRLVCKLTQKRQMSVLRIMGDALLERRRASILQVAREAKGELSCGKDLIVFFEVPIHMRAAIFVRCAQHNGLSRELVAPMDEH